MYFVGEEAIADTDITQVKQFLIKTVQKLFGTEVNL